MDAVVDAEADAVTDAKEIVQIVAIQRVVQHVTVLVKINAMVV